MNGFVRSLPGTARILLGLVFLVFGLNAFFRFLPETNVAPLPDEAVAFAQALQATGYLFVLVKLTEVAAGVLLLSNRFVPLALTVLAPVVVNIVAFHLFLAPDGIAMALFVLALELFLAFNYRDAFRPMLAARVRPSVRAAAPAVEDRAIEAALGQAGR